MELVRAKDYTDMSRKAANIISAQVILHPDTILGLATGDTPKGTYAQLAEWQKKGDCSFARCSSYNLDEYVGLSDDHPQSYHYFMRKYFFDLVDIDIANTHVPDGAADDPAAACEEYDRMVAAAGYPDLQLLGIGRNGHIGFNEPGDKFVYGCHVVDLSESTIDANKRFFDSADDVPRQAVSLGIGSIMKAKTILLLATGEDKAEAVRAMVQDEINPQVQATILRTHPSVIVLLDAAAASKL